MLLTMANIATACNVPVFRYALERWRPDSCEVVVFHDGTFSSSQEQFLRSLDEYSLDNNGTANMKVMRQHTSEPMDNSVSKLWSSLQVAEQKITVPWLVVRSRAGRGRLVNSWNGSLDDAVSAGIVESPARKELSRRLVTGDSAVWLVLKSDDADRNTATVELLTKQLNELSNKIPLPEGVGLPGSELFSDIPLLMKFSVLEIDPHDVDETYLVSLLHGLDPDSKAAGDPLVVPVFGRGRALEVIPASKVDAGLIEDLTLFLCGACSCQVKDMNPGFDLLLSTAWNIELFGEEAAEVSARMEADIVDVALPELVLIPPGKSTTTDGSMPAEQVSELRVSYSVNDVAVKEPGAAISVFWAIAILTVFVGFVVISKVFRPSP